MICQQLSEEPTVITKRIAQEFELLSLQCRAGLIDGEGFRARRKALYDQIVIAAAKRAERNVADCSWYPVEVTNA